MEIRLRPYRFASFAILALALTSIGAEIGWWWIVPLLAGLGGFAVADSFMRHRAHPEPWVAAALPLLLAGAVAVTGRAASPVLMWLALPALTLGARFEPRGTALGTAYIVVLLLLVPGGLDPPPPGGRPTS